MSKLNAHTCEMMHYIYSTAAADFADHKACGGEKSTHIYVSAPERGIIAPLTLKVTLRVYCSMRAAETTRWIFIRFVFIKTHASAFFSFHIEIQFTFTPAARFGDAEYTHGGAVNNLLMHRMQAHNSKRSSHAENRILASLCAVWLHTAETER